MNRAQLKATAKAQIKGNVVMLAVITVIAMAITYVAMMIPLLGLIVGPVMSLALLHVYLKLTRGVKPEINELFAHFNELLPALKVNLLSGIFVFLWSLLLVIPGIIKSFAYSQAMYILAENPGIGAREALKRSEEMMNGHKMEMFILGLSFMGWYILGTFTFGLLYIWLIPYMQATMTNFYNAIKPKTGAIAADYEDDYATVDDFCTPM
jgi:uncharacterized membrane protein